MRSSAAFTSTNIAMRKAAAVVIGVDKTGGLDPLKSAARGAKEIAAWLAAEKFDVSCLTDSPVKSVTSQDVSSAIAGYVTKPATYDLLVVYFSGHGQWHTRADHWLLSGAPQNTAEAINLEGAMYTARKCGIPNVVFISDACRTIPRTDVDSLVNGVDAFPNHGITPVSKIDFFKATSDSRPAYETSIDGSAQSVLTHAILAAFEDPDPAIVAQIVDGVETVSVIPNRRLETVLQARVDAILDDVNGSPTQELDINVPSADDIYLGRVHVTPVAAGGGPPQGGAPPSTPRGPRGPNKPVNTAGSLLTIDSAISAPSVVDREAIALRLPDPTADHFETQTGFIIRGAHVVDAAISPQSNGKFDLLNDGNDPRGDALRIYASAPGYSVVVRLKDGRCAVLAALRGYLGHAQFDDEGLVNVSYVPSSNTGRWSAYQERREEIDQLRARVALAVNRNSFRLKSAEEAVMLADRIRVDKAADPTLGLYAAYAFAQAGIDQQVRDVGGYMRMDLGLDLFDVRMLSNEGQDSNPLVGEQVPFCPMLTQGWNILRAYKVKLPSVLQYASPFLANSLWSTFTRRGADAVFEAVKGGELR